MGNLPWRIIVQCLVQVALHVLAVLAVERTATWRVGAFCSGLMVPMMAGGRLGWRDLSRGSGSKE